MKIYKNSSDFIDFELPIHLRTHLLPVIKNGFNFYKEFILENNLLFQSILLKNIKGFLLTYIISRHFEPDMVSTNFPFNFIPEKVNNFEYRSANLRSGNVLINIGRARLPNGLPSRSKYKIKRCSQNNFDHVLQLFDIDHENKLFVNNMPYYCFLTYRIEKDLLSSVNLIVPDSKMTRYIENIDLLDEYSAIKLPEEKPEVKEVEIAKLKQEIIEQIQLTKLRGRNG